jgi:predicted ATPase
MEPKSSRGAFFERADSGAGAGRFVARIERQSHPRYFAPDRPRTLLSELSDPVYHPHVVAAAREIGSWRTYYVEPTQMRQRIGVQTAEEPGRRGEVLAAYYWTLQRQNPAVLAGIVRNLREFVPGLVSLRVDVSDGVLELVAGFQGGTEFPARLLSEGTLRLLCIVGLCVAPRPPAVVVYEEPENGVSPGRLELLADMLRNAVSVRPSGPQFILTTHSLQVCELLTDRLILCTWDAEGGTRFHPFEWNREDLYFRDALRRAVDEATRGVPPSWSSQVAEDEP